MKNHWLPKRENGELVISGGVQRRYEDGPAGIYSDGTKSWWRNGESREEGGPAVICVDTTN